MKIEINADDVELQFPFFPLRRSENHADGHDGGTGKCKSCNPAQGIQKSTSPRKIRKPNTSLFIFHGVKRVQVEVQHERRISSRRH